ncbi:MAG: hypothetical protein H7A37_08510 [Chlamydiales bacterium]|nr:hypothetical protein [Chlamydiia bacterium]MCP5508320.1 hypothetical protein [Chlamydiales bacterium]
MFTRADVVILIDEGYVSSLIRHPSLENLKKHLSNDVNVRIFLENKRFVEGKGIEQVTALFQRHHFLPNRRYFPIESTCYYQENPPCMEYQYFYIEDKILQLQEIDNPEDTITLKESSLHRARVRSLFYFTCEKDSLKIHSVITTEKVCKISSKILSCESLAK